MNSYLVHLIAIGANFLLSKLSSSNGRQNWEQYQGLFQTTWRIGINMFVTELAADNVNQNGLSNHHFTIQFAYASLHDY